MTPDRRARHHRLSTILASCTDAELVALLEAGRAGTAGVGGSPTQLDLDGTPVFAKRIALTDQELLHPHCTANLFDLPTHCQYGIGSPGFNAWRELAANVMVTDASLAGETDSFPLLHHWRVLPGRPPIAAEHADIETAIAALGGSPAVRARLEALAAATHSLVLFCEYIPYSMHEWLNEDPAEKAESVERQLDLIVEFLRSHELLHMDGHFANMRTDGELVYLSDFGLATSQRFDLSAAERDFIRDNNTHDAGYAAMVLTNWLVTSVCGVPVPASGGPRARNEYVRACAAGAIPDDVPPTVAAILRRQAPVAARMNIFYWKLFGGDLTAEFTACTQP